MDEIDIWRSAAAMIARYGTDAAIQAALRADKLLEDGDADGVRVWKRVVTAITTLSKTRSDERLN